MLSFVPLEGALEDEGHSPGARYSCLAHNKSLSHSKFDEPSLVSNAIETSPSLPKIPLHHIIFSQIQYSQEYQPCVANSGTKRHGKSYYCFHR